MYEGLSRVYFACGWVGHQKWNCNFTSSKNSIVPIQNIGTSEENSDRVEASQSEIPVKTTQSVPEGSKASKEQTDQYGPWILVERKRNRGPHKKGPNEKKLEGSSKMG